MPAPHLACSAGTLTASQANPLVYFDIQLGREAGAEKLGRIVMELKVRQPTQHNQRM